MEILKELINLLNKHKTKHIEVIGNPTTNKSQVYQFYERIVDGTFSSDQEAAAHLFNDTASNQRYKNLKAKLKKRLLSTVFFIDISDSMFNEYEKAYVNCYKDWAAAKILFGKSAQKAGINITLKVMKQARKADFLDISIEACRILRSHYGSLHYNKRKFNYYNDLLKESLHIREQELFAEECYLKLMSHYFNSKSPKYALKKEATYYSELIKKECGDINTMLFIVLQGMVEVAKFLCINNYVETAEVCRLTIEKLENKPIIWKSGLATFFFQEIVCRIQLKQYEKGKTAIESMFHYIEVGTFNWFKGQELFMYLLFHTKKYDQTYAVYKSVLKNKRLQFLPENTKESWKIFKAYIHFLIEIKIIDQQKDSEFSKFRLGKFLNEVPGFSQDKRGANISILVIQILFTVVLKNYNKAIDRIEAIEKYATRYLKKDNHFRSNCFIKMLLEIPKGNFHRVAVERKSKKYWIRLQEMPIEVANQTHSIEIIPYEDLWEMTLNLLDPKKKL